MNRSLLLFLLFAWATLAAHADDDTPSLFAAAQEKATASAKGRLNPADLQTNPELLDSLEVPLLSEFAVPVVQRFERQMVAGFWTFYTSAWWQITIRGLLAVCAVYGIGYYAYAITSGEMEATKAYARIFMKLAIAITVILSVAPNAPFVLTRYLNTVTRALAYKYNEAQLVALHKQQLAKKALLMEAQAATALENRLNDQYYTEDFMPPIGSEAPSLWSFLARTDVPLYTKNSAMLRGIQYVSPLVTVEGQPVHLVTPQAFVFIGPPALGAKYQHQAKNGRTYLVAHPCPEPVWELPYSGFLGFFSLSVSAADGGFELANPVTGMPRIVPKRPFAAPVSAALRLYDDLAAKWASLPDNTNRRQLLRAVDAAAQTAIATGWNTLAQDIVDNQAFALTPPLDPTPAQSVSMVGATVPLAIAGTPATNDPANEEAARRSREIRDKTLKDFSANLERIQKELRNELKTVDSTVPNKWTMEKIIPLALVVCSFYCTLAIWLLPPLLGLWACFFLLPPVLGDLSNALKRGGAVIIALVFYPILLQLLVMFCVTITAAGTELDSEIDPSHKLVDLVVYGALPGGGTVTAAGTKAGAAVFLRGVLKESDAGIATMVTWIITVAVIVLSPGIAAKMILGSGAADAIAQPSQASAVAGGGMGLRAVISGGAAMGSDALQIGASVARRFGRR